MIPVRYDTIHGGVLNCSNWCVIAQAYFEGLVVSGFLALKKARGQVLLLQYARYIYFVLFVCCSVPLVQAGFCVLMLNTTRVLCFVFCFVCGRCVHLCLWLAFPSTIQSSSPCLRWRRKRTFRASKQLPKTRSSKGSANG